MVPYSYRNGESGFSLIELAVVLVIVGLLVGGGIAVLDVTTQQAHRSEQTRQLEAVRDALYGFAMSEGRLPCPDTDVPPDGITNPTPAEHGAGDTCAEDTGTLPWQQLGLARRNPWGQPLLYHVDRDFADDDPEDGSTFDLAEPANVKVNDDDGDLIANTPAVVVSVAGQGLQVWTDTGFVCPGADGAPASGFSSDETENCDGNDIYIAAGYRTEDSGGGRFDDLLIWLPTPVLKARMVEVGRLP